MVLSLRQTAIGLALTSALYAPALAAETAVSGSVQQSVDEATIVILPERCAGAIVGDRHSAITAAHCIGNERSLDVRLHDGRKITASIVRVDRQRDVALIRFDQDVPVQPLTLAEQLPRAGEALYFGGRADRHGSQQVFAVVKIGRCPSMPDVEEAIFTNLRARKGDSGAPLVNKSLEVVGLVHGGATCNIAAPTVGLNAALGLSRDGASRCAWGHC